MKLSIGIISYQIDGELIHTLESLGTIPDDCEVVLKVSTDTHIERLELIANVRALLTGDNGIYNAMNKIRSAARGDFLWYLNAGDARHPNLTLTETMDLLTEHTC